MCVLWEHCRSAHSAASDDPTGGSGAVARNSSGQTAAPSRRLTRRARRLPLSLIEWDSDFHIRDWGRTVHESCEERASLVVRSSIVVSEPSATRIDETPGQPRLSLQPHTRRNPLHASQTTCHRSRSVIAPSAKDPGQARWPLVFVQRAVADSPRWTRAVGDQSNPPSGEKMGK